MVTGMHRFLAIFLLFAITGCTVPQWRIFQAKVDPKLAEKPEKQIEAERRAAKYIAQESRSLAPNPAQQVADINAVAEPLSQSLGEPKKPVEPADQSAIIASLRGALADSQAREDKWKEWARKHGGKELEGTGVNLFTPSALLGVAGLVALCVFMPGFLTFLLFVIRRFRSTTQQLAQAVEEFQIEEPAAAAKLKASFDATLDKSHKNVIDSVKSHLDQRRLEKKRRLISTAGRAA